jgi:hypothetical protein
MRHGKEIDKDWTVNAEEEDRLERIWKFVVHRLLEHEVS